MLDNENGSKISIGDNCSVGYNVSFLTANHDFSDAKKRGGKLIAKDITIGDGCWIGANVTILAGIVIGNSSVIAAGAVVTKNCEPNAVYAGVPAIKIKSIK